MERGLCCAGDISNHRQHLRPLPVPNFSKLFRVIPHAFCLSVTVFGQTGNCGTVQQGGEGVESKKGGSKGVKMQGKGEEGLQTEVMELRSYRLRADGS